MRYLMCFDCLIGNALTKKNAVLNMIWDMYSLSQSMFDNCYRYTHTVIYYVNKQCTVSGYVCTMTPYQLIFITGPNLCCKGNHFDYEHLSPSGTLLTCD